MIEELDTVIVKFLVIITIAVANRKKIKKRRTNNLLSLFIYPLFFTSYEGYCAIDSWCSIGNE